MSAVNTVSTSQIASLGDFELHQSHAGLELLPQPTEMISPELDGSLGFQYIVVIDDLLYAFNGLKEFVRSAKQGRPFKSLVNVQVQQILEQI